MISSTQKPWLSPFLAVTWFAVSVTGILMLFHLKFSGMYPIHKWGGLAFIIAGAVHLVMNWRVFTSYFQKSTAVWGTLAGVLAMIVIFLAVPSRDNTGRYHDGLQGGSFPYNHGHRR